ncbi:MAG TPA: DUF72 domain-containing protein [Chthoniobacterales bacterium]
MLDLFGPDFDREAMGERLAGMAAKGAWVGTSSWKYPGWLGLLYDRSRYEARGRYSERRFEEECLAEYALFFRSVCVDAGYYKFPDARYLEKLCSQVDAGFRFTFKVTDTITLQRYPKLPRFGTHAGLVNPHYLDAEYFVDHYLKPLVPHRQQVGVLIFEFSEFRPGDAAAAEQFLLVLDEFLGALPRGWNYGVEIRTPGFLQSTYFALLRRHNVAHVYNQWTRMPSAEEQLALTGSDTADFAAARLLLTPGRAYEEAVQDFSPYVETREVDRSARHAGRRLIWEVALEQHKPVFVYINNRLEGNALRTIWALTEKPAR